MPREHLSFITQVRGDNFVGCAFDEDNQPDESEDRAKKWVEQIKGEGIAIHPQEMARTIVPRKVPGAF